MKILISGVAGFIGYHLCKNLLGTSHEIIGIDNLNDYYDVNLKYDRLKELGIKNINPIDSNETSSICHNLEFLKLDLQDLDGLKKLFEKHRFDIVINLAAQAGVRYSLTNPHTYVDSNITGFLNILECCRNFNVKNLLYASSSSVYGLNKGPEFDESQNTDKPISLYAASKKSNELMAHTYSNLFGIKCVGLRFFTVYGSWGRPDMALYIFAKAALEKKPVDVYNYGNMLRDFTHVSDIVNGIVLLTSNMENLPLNKVLNIGRGSPVSLENFIAKIEDKLGHKIIKKYLPLQLGDVPSTHANVEEIQKYVDYKPITDVNEGINEFCKWFLKYYNK